MAKDVASAVLDHGRGKQPKLPKKVLDHIRISPRMGGGVTAMHHYDSYQHEPKPHEFGADKGKEFAAHMQEHTGMDMGAGEGAAAAGSKGGTAEAES